MLLSLLLSPAVWVPSAALTSVDCSRHTAAAGRRRPRCDQHRCFARGDGFLGHQIISSTLPCRGVAASILEDTVPEDLSSAVLSVAAKLWGGLDDLRQVLPHQDASSPTEQLQGEMPLPADIPNSDRCNYFLQKAHLGDARAQHSLALLLWNGFGSASRDAQSSAKWHAASAAQGNLDALALLGGCLHTGTGVKGNVGLGLRCIEYAASMGNPTGVNKKAALMESNGDWRGAANLYRACYEEGTRKNALLLFNLGYCLVNGEGIQRDVSAGGTLWEDAVGMAPDEGSEEAAWFLHLQYSDDEILSRHWLQIAADLGHQEAIDATNF